MFNFLVTFDDGAWDRPSYEYDRSRFLEYTSDDIEARFRELESAQIDALKAMPCLFAYEGSTEPMRVGRLKRVELHNHGQILYLEPEIDATVRPIPFRDIEPLKGKLGIFNWEFSRTHWAIKDKDLFAVLGAAGIHVPDAESETVEKKSLPERSPPKFRATNVAAFVKLVSSLIDGNRAVFYRGHSDRDKYKLEPSLFRQDAHGVPIYRDAEDRMYKELLVSNSADFHDDVYTLDRLVRMQHYSLPTRLLDITSNPLIALYFACKGKPSVDGEVIVLAVNQSQIKYFDSDTASCIANLARLSQKSKDSIDYRTRSVRKFNRQTPVKQLLHFIKEEKPFFEERLEPSHLQSVICVKGKHTNSRISFQSGAFLLFGHDATLAEKGTDEIKVRRIAVMSADKATILKELDHLNINESTVFPYIENSAKYIAEKFRFKR